MADVWTIKSTKDVASEIVRNGNFLYVFLRLNGSTTWLNHFGGFEPCLCDWAYKRSRATYRKEYRAQCHSGMLDNVAPNFINQVIIKHQRTE